jgi:AAA15 family ATPase/GTPase
MAIGRVEIKDFLVFKGEFAVEFCPGVNVLIGANATGKTTLLKMLYENIRTIISHRTLPDIPYKMIFNIGQTAFSRGNVRVLPDVTENAHAVYIPEKDILEHAKGLLTFIEDKQTGFSLIYKDVLIKAQDIPTQKQTETQKNIGKIISDEIGGEVKWDKGDGSFYTIKTNGDRIPFANEASGFKKLGFLGLLVACGQLESGTVLFWDEPENSLNPELMPVLVEILLKLQSDGVQIFLATHSYNLARYFDIKKPDTNSVMFFNLSKTENGSIECVSSSEYTNLSENVLEKADEKLFNAVVADAMGIQGNE